MVYRLSGQINDGSAADSKPIAVLDTQDADPSNWSIVETTTSDSNGNWSVTVPAADPERYHAVAQIEDGSTKYTARSKPFLSALPVLQGQAVPLQFDVLSPNISAGSAIPDSGEHQWYMDEGSGTTLNDSVDGVSASVNGATWNTESGPVGGEYLSFVTDDYVLTDQSIDAAQTTFTVFGWARINTFSGFDHALTSAADPGNNSGAGWNIFTEGTSGEIGTVFAGSSFNRNIPFPSSGWGFFALIVDNQTYRLITFDNSSELADDTQSGSDRTPRTGDKLHLGRDARDQDYFDGDLDFCGFADKTLTKTEVTDLWDATKR